MARMLTCNRCKTVDVLPDYASENDPEAKFDTTLKDAIDKHLGKYGGGPEHHPAQLFSIADDELALIDTDRLKQAVHDGNLEEFLKEEREQYKEDALGCYNTHNRPVVGFPGCRDYRNSEMAVGRTTGIDDADKVYLCDFCVYQSYVDHEKYKKAGLYGK